MAVGLLAAMLTVPAAPVHAAGPSSGAADGGIRAAIARSVADRMGGDAVVTVTALKTRVMARDGLVASPEPGARTSAPARFVLFSGASRVGVAVATVDVSIDHVRATRAIGRDETIASDDVEAVHGALAAQPIRRVPALHEVIGTRARRAIAPGEPVTAAVTEVKPLVQTGDRVSVAVRIGAVIAEGQGTASGSGHVGDVIRVVNHASRQSLKARITGPGEVEVVQ